MTTTDPAAMPAAGVSSNNHTYYPQTTFRDKEMKKKDVDVSSVAHPVLHLLRISFSILESTSGNNRISWRWDSMRTEQQPSITRRRRDLSVVATSSG